MTYEFSYHPCPRCHGTRKVNIHGTYMFCMKCVTGKVVTMTQPVSYKKP